MLFWTFRVWQVTGSFCITHKQKHGDIYTKKDYTKTKENCNSTLQQTDGQCCIPIISKTAKRKWLWRLSVGGGGGLLEG